MAAQRGRGRGSGRGRRRRGCPFCADGVKFIDYKNVDLLSRYVSDRGKIKPRRKSNLCAQHQRHLAAAVKRARQAALLPYTAEHVRLTS